MRATPPPPPPSRREKRSYSQNATREIFMRGEKKCISLSLSDRERLGKIYSWERHESQ